MFNESILEAAMLKKTASRTIACALGILLATLLAALMPGLPAPARGCSACAGPGSDVYVRAHIVIEDGTMSRLDVLWDLSETLAQSLAVQHDLNQDGRLDPAERLALEEAFVSGLRVGNYHTALFVNAQELEPLPLDNPRVEWRGTSPQFLFSIPLQEPVGDGLQLRLRTHDPEMHLQFYHRQDSVSWNQPACCRLNDNSQLFPRELEMDIQPSERIVSRGQASPKGFWYDQEQAEFVLLISGSAGLLIEGHENVLILRPGDYLNIDARLKHRVEWTQTGCDTTWLAVHYSEGNLPIQPPSVP